MAKARQAGAGSTGRASEPDAAGIGQDPAAQTGSGSGNSTTPHRPSRRHLIVMAAVRVFSRKGFTEASIQEIATEAGMVPTAVYNHFAGKQELFENALRYAMEASSFAEQPARSDSMPNPESFRGVAAALWDRVAEYPEAAQMLSLHLAGDATASTRLIAMQYEASHLRRAVEYCPAGEAPLNRRAAAAQSRRPVAAYPDDARDDHRDTIYAHQGRATFGHTCRQPAHREY